MDATLNSNMQGFSCLPLLESFFEAYPPKKAEAILWRWLISSIKNDFSKLTEEDFLEFADFFEKLHHLELVLYRQYQDQLKSKDEGREL